MAYRLREWFDEAWLRENILELYHIERKQTFPAWIRAAETARDLLSAEGFEAEYIPFAADGKTSWQDKVMPIGWDASDMRLTLLTDVPGIADNVLCDSAREPAAVVKHSAATPAGGVEARLVTQSRMKAGEDVTGAFVLLDPDARPHKGDLQMLLDLGALGYVSDYIENPLDTPDHASWLNAGTELANWHCFAGERPFIGYMISPRTGFYLRAACQNGPVRVRAFSDARTYESELPVVTALLRGETDREVWLVAHLYEPLIDDNSSGVVGCVAVLKALRAMAEAGKLRLRHSVRVLFISEMYGSAAYIERIGDGRKKAIGAINMDGLVASADKRRDRYQVIEGPDHSGGDGSVGFAGNPILAEATEAYAVEHPEVRYLRRPCHMSDDCCISDSTVGIPTVWLYHVREGLHHNTKQDESLIAVDALMDHLDLCGEWIAGMACTDAAAFEALLPRAAARENELLARSARSAVRPGDGDAKMRYLYERSVGRLEALRVLSGAPEGDDLRSRIELPAFAGTESSGPSDWFERCACYRFERRTRGFPHDLTRLPVGERFLMPGDILDSDLALVMSRLRPEVSLREVLREVEWVVDRRFSEAEIRRWLEALMRLARAGYLDVRCDAAASRAGLGAALREIGVTSGGVLAVECRSQDLRCLPGGAADLLEELEDIVGDSGTLLAPAFARSWVLANGRVNESNRFRPYDPRPDGALRDRTLRDDDFARTLFGAGAARSGHPSHEWAALGRDEGRLVGEHGFSEDPADGHSPLMRAMAEGGSLLLVGVAPEDSEVLKLLRAAARPEACGQGVVQAIDATGKVKLCLFERFPDDTPVDLDGAEAYVRRTAFLGTPIVRVDLKGLYEALRRQDRNDD